MKPIKRLLIANRSEIAIRVFRSARELGITPVALYSYEDRYALHRFLADEAYQVGQAGEPIKSYLHIANILALAKAQRIDAIHPGYGFLSENPAFARACTEAGIIFVGPSPEVLEKLGDKTAARKIAISNQVPILDGASKALRNADEGLEIAEKTGYPVILKAAHGGGGRGMRIVSHPDKFQAAYQEAQRESMTAFASKDIYIEKFISRARHIEVQILADEVGNLVHLYERDCSIQRRYQKVVEIAPAPNLDPVIRQSLCDAACKIATAANYQNAGTVEFLVDVDSGQFYFIEFNPRIQVEHTVTEEVTSFDIVRAQLLIAQGYALAYPGIGIANQESVTTHGYALQCRVTTEDPTNNFLPDYGRLSHYRSSSGIGIRLDAGSAFSGAIVTPFFDSMLVKVSARARSFDAAITRMTRALNEFRVRGVKTNIPFLLRLLDHPTFRESRATTRFIDETPELLAFKLSPSRTSRILAYISDTIVNGNPLLKNRPIASRRQPIATPASIIPDSSRTLAQGSRDIFLDQGVDGLIRWIKEADALLITDTTFRDAQQSLFATRMRSIDMLNIANSYACLAPQLFSLEMWGGATFDTSLRFLKEDPWQRLTELRERIPNILFQMLLRASSVVGYVNYPDNLVREFIREATQAGMDIFRIFDALNWTPNMEVAMDSSKKFGAICEATICYTGDILDPKKTKYDLDYYLQLARQLEQMGADILCIKDMAGLLKPAAASLLIPALKAEVNLPIHFHTHDTSGIQAATILNASEAGLDIADAAMAPLSGGTSQPNLNTLVAALEHHSRATRIASKEIDRLAEYWRQVREFYTPFAAETLPASADLYQHEMPGGQYTNLFEQARALGLADRWVEICDCYAQVNDLFGNIIKVTPTSKVVGDMALFMVANGLSTVDVLDSNRELAFPQSVKDLMSGRMGQAYQGLPEEIVKRVLREEEPLRVRAGSILPDADLNAEKVALKKMGCDEPTTRHALSSLLYPGPFADLLAHQNQYDDTSHLPTPVFFYGLKMGEEITIDTEYGNSLIIKFLTIGEAHADGSRTAFYEINAQPREVQVIDNSLVSSTTAHKKADLSNDKHIASSIPGMVASLLVAVGDSVAKGQAILSLEAMKMESTLYFERAGKVAQLLVTTGSQVDSGDLLLILE